MRVIAGTARGVPLRSPPSAGTRPTTDKVRGAVFDILAADIVDARVLDLYAGTGAMGVEALSRGAEGCLFVERAPAVCRVIDLNLRAARVDDRAVVWPLMVDAALGRLQAIMTSMSPNREEQWDTHARFDQQAGRSTTDAGADRAVDSVESIMVGDMERDGTALDGPGRVGSRGARRPMRGPVGVRRSLPSTVAPPYTIVVLDPPYDDPAIMATVERVGHSGLLVPSALVVLEHGKRLQVPEHLGLLRLHRTRLYGDTAVTIWVYPAEEQEEG